MFKSISGYIDYKYTLRFLIVLITFYYFNIFYLGITTSGGDYYSPFLDEYANYIHALTGSLLYASHWLLELVGFHSVIDGDNIIRGSNASSVQVWLPCLGLGVMATWVAFVLSKKVRLKDRMLWISYGLILIWGINCIRITLLLIALSEGWRVIGFVDHHDLFNIVSYALIICLGYLYNRVSSYS